MFVQNTWELIDSARLRVRTWISFDFRQWSNRFLLVAEIGSRVYNTGATIDNQHLIATQDNGKPVPFHDADVFSKGLRYPAGAIASYSSDNGVICDLVGGGRQSTSRVSSSLTARSTKASSRRRPWCSSRSPRSCMICRVRREQSGWRSCGAPHDQALW